MSLEPQSHTRLRDLERQRDEARRERDEARESRDRAEAITCQIELENSELLRIRGAFRDRLERSRDALDAIAIERQDQRVRGKAQGLELALSYLDEWERGVFR